MAHIQHGRHHVMQAAQKLTNNCVGPAVVSNLITRRTVGLPQQFHQRNLSSTLQSANLKSLRLYRHICRLLPFIIKIHEIPHRVTPNQAKAYVANWFRKHANIPLHQIDSAVQFGYQTVYEAEMEYSNTGYIYKYIMGDDHHKRDRAIDRFDDLRGNKLNKQTPTKFLKNFYRGNKTHDL